MPTLQATLKFNIVTDDGEPSSVTVFPPGRAPLVATKESKNFATIIRFLTGEETASDEESIYGLFDLQPSLNAKFTKVSDRVSIRGGQVYLDNMKQDGVLADTIIKFFLAQHDDYMSLVNFMEKIETNPNPHSRENLFRWLKNGRFSITPDGDIICYKGVNRRTGQDTRDEYYQSVTAGPAIVDGQPMTGHIPNDPGVIVEMPRNEVTFDPNQTCSKGLHVAEWGYASGFGHTGITLMVLVNPRDVVSVPSDSNDHKMRVCRYKVLKRVHAEEQQLLHVDTALQTLTARFVEYVPGQGQLVRGKGATKRGVKKAAAKVKKVAKKAVAKKVVKKAVAKKNAPAKAAPKPTTVAKKGPALPKYYEEFTVEDFGKLPYTKLQWIAKQWDVSIKGARTASALSVALVAEGTARIEKARSYRDKTKHEG